MSFKRIILIVSFLMLLSLPVLCDQISFSLYHQVNVDASLEYKFLDNQGSVISSKALQVGANEIGGFYATFNTTRQVSVGLRWEPLIRDGEAVAAADTVYPYVMTVTSPSGSALPVYASVEAGELAGAGEFVVNDVYGSGNAYFINKWLTKSSSGSFDTSKICGMTITIEENGDLPAGTYSGNIYFIATGS